MKAAVKNRWSATVSDMDLYYTGLLDARCALETSFFFLSIFLSFSLYYGLFGGVTCGVSVWNGGQTELTASVHYLHRVLD